MKQLRPVRSMLRCYFCGGRVEAVGSGRTVIGYRCAAEGVRWDDTENLVLYARDHDPPRVTRDSDSGKFVSAS